MASTERQVLEGQFDSVVMLTWSDWKTEPRSNRYHYATRFARHLPVIFVQPDLETASYEYEDTATQGLCLLHVYRRYGQKQRKILARALRQRKVLRPLLWAYNAYLADFFAECYAPLKVYHATEDYFVPGGSGNQFVAAKLRQLLCSADLLVAVSVGVRESYVRAGQFKGASLVLENGCDFDFWREGATRARPEHHGQRIAFYQGGINRRLDWQLIARLVDRLPEWEFWFCGQAQEDSTELRLLRRRRNFRYLGPKTPTELREVASHATVGLIPFVQEPYIRVSMPLKAFEYVACDLPVVSVPIEALRPFPSLFALATNAEDFATAMEASVSLRSSPDAAAERSRFAARSGYDKRFQELQDWIGEFLTRKGEGTFRTTVLLLYDINSTHVNTLNEHLSSFGLFSRHDIFYANCTGTARAKLPLSNFGAVIIHYSVRVNLLDHLSGSYGQALREYAGLKVLFIQDEYDTTEIARRAIEDLGVHVVFTCVPHDSIPTVYNTDRFPFVKFKPTLTGYVPLSVRSVGRPIPERTVLIGYRGRALPYWYGDLGQEKKQIGQRMKEECEKRSLHVDIEWDDCHRIYGEAWYEFLGNARATLGTESGSNVFDDTGAIRSSIENALLADPLISYEKVRTRLLAGKEGPVRMNQISPKIFEAIASRTALILFEGEYSGVVQADRHYIALRKDFANIDAVLSKIQDDAFVTELTERAYAEIVGSGTYSYASFIREVDELIAAAVRNKAGAAVLAVAHARKATATAEWTLFAGFRISQHPTSAPLQRTDSASGAHLLSSRFGKALIDVAQPIWHKVPHPIRRILWPAVHAVFGAGRLAVGLLRRGR